MEEEIKEGKAVSPADYCLYFSGVKSTVAM
jgi:hypothetical protein